METAIIPKSGFPTPLIFILEFTQKEINWLQTHTKLIITDFTMRKETFDKRMESYKQGGIFIDSIRSLLTQVLANQIHPKIIQQIIMKIHSKEILSPHSPTSFFNRLCTQRNPVSRIIRTCAFILSPIILLFSTMLIQSEMPSQTRTALAISTCTQGLLHYLN